MKNHQVSGDGKTVWVDDNMGGCIARFSKHGIDIHATTEQQIETGLPCLFCTHVVPGPSDWDLFVKKVRELHGVKILKSFMPDFIKKVSTA
jgi:hypothetical protein